MYILNKNKRGLVLLLEFVLLSMIALIIGVAVYKIISISFETLSIKKDIDEKLPKLKEDIHNFIKKAITQGSYASGLIYVPRFTQISYDGNVIVFNYVNPSVKKVITFRDIEPCIIKWYSLPSQEGIYRIIIETKIENDKRICEIETIPTK